MCCVNIEECIIKQVTCKYLNQYISPFTFFQLLLFPSFFKSKYRSTTKSFQIEGFKTEILVIRWDELFCYKVKIIIQILLVDYFTGLDVFF